VLLPGLLQLKERQLASVTAQLQEQTTQVCEHAVMSCNMS
jgi:hypothetical protein